MNNKGVKVKYPKILISPFFKKNDLFTDFSIIFYSMIAHTEHNHGTGKIERGVG